MKGKTFMNSDENYINILLKGDVKRIRLMIQQELDRENQY